MGPLNTYEIGQPVLLEGKSKDDDGLPAAPNNPRILLKTPDGTESSLEVEVSGATFSHEYYVTGPAGLYTYRLLTDDDALELSFQVVPSEFESPLG